MAGSRRMSISAVHRQRTVKGEPENAYQQSSRHIPPRESGSFPTQKPYTVQEAPTDRCRPRSYSVKQDYIPRANTVYAVQAGATESQPPQLPSLRTLIDLPPLQASNMEYTHQRPSPTSPCSITSQRQPLHYRDGYTERPCSAGGYVSAPHSAVPSSYYDNRYQSRRPSVSEVSYMPSTRHGPVNMRPDMTSPSSTTSTMPPGYFADQYALHHVRPEHQIRHKHAPPIPTTEHMVDSGQDTPFQGSMPQFALIASKRASLAAAGPTSQPRCIGQESIAGKGLCYVYDDGTYCEAIVRGEPVNPEWGLTRAGRARKRLAKACNGCREKKVKCEPGTTSRCQRCLRKGQECQWTEPPCSETSPDRESYHVRSASRSTYTRQDPAYDQQYSTRLPLTPAYTVSSRISYDAVSSVPDPEARPSSKRLRSDSPERDSIPITANPERRRITPFGDMSSSNVPSQSKAVFHWDMDPYQSDPGKANLLLHLFFEYRDTATNCVLPRESFWGWVRTAPSRTRDEKVLLYVVLAVGSLFSTDVVLKDVGSRYISIARLAEGENASRHSLPLALVRLHLAFYYFATGNGEQSYYYVHSSFRTINALHLNTQNGVMDVPADSKMWDFGLNRVELIECRRRIFWLGYMTERYSSFVSNISLFSNAEEDIFLHIPNNERNYQAGIESLGPLFDGGFVERHALASSSHHYSSQRMSPTSASGAPTGSELGAMALSITIAQIWGDVQRHTYRSLHSRRPNHSSLAGHSSITVPGTNYVTRHEAFATTTLRRLADWEYSLPGHLQYSATNTWRNILCGNSGDLDTYLALQCVNFATRIHLARFARWRDLNLEAVKHNIRAANAAARELLALVSALARDAEKKSSSAESATSPGSTATDRAFANPFIGHAILLAADTVSAAGNIERHFRDTVRSLSDAATVLHLVGAFFATAARQETLLRGRIAELHALVQAAGNVNGSGTGRASGGADAAKPTWRQRESCALVPVPGECDVVYDVEEQVYADAMAGAGGWPDVRV